MVPVPVQVSLPLQPASQVLCWRPTRDQRAINSPSTQLINAESEISAGCPRRRRLPAQPAATSAFPLISSVLAVLPTAWRTYHPEPRRQRPAARHDWSNGDLTRQAYRGSRPTAAHATARLLHARDVGHRRGAGAGGWRRGGGAGGVLGAGGPQSRERNSDVQRACCLRLRWCSALEATGAARVAASCWLDGLIRQISRVRPCARVAAPPCRGTAGRLCVKNAVWRCGPMGRPMPPGCPVPPDAR